VFCHPCTFTYAYLAVDVRKNGFFTDDATAAAALVASDFCTLYAYMSPYVSTSATKNPKNPKNPKNSAKKLKFAKNKQKKQKSQNLPKFAKKNNFFQKNPKTASFATSAAFATSTAYLASLVCLIVLKVFCHPSIPS
jgi:hypothetical protein